MHINISKIIYFAIPLAVIASYAPLSAQENKPIIVTGKTLDQTLANLNSCLEKNCPPDQDIDASLAHAENLFVAGEYKDAREIIDDSIKRNKRHAADYPIPVSDLYRSNGRVLEHLGLIDKSNFAVLKVRDTLEDHLPDELDRILYAELEISDALLKDGNFPRALRKIRYVINEARENGLYKVANFARLRELNIELSLVERKTRSAALEVRDDIIEYIDDVAANDIEFYFPGRILLARVDRQLGMTDSTNELINSYAITYGRKKPLLLSADAITIKPIIEPIISGFFNSAKTSLTTENFNDRWADIGFWVNENGSVESIETLRIKGDPHWIEAVVKSIDSRVYAPRYNKETQTPLGQYVVERYSYTSEFEKAPGSNLVVRTGNPIVRRLDLTIYDEN